MPKLPDIPPPVRYPPELTVQHWHAVPPWPVIITPTHADIAQDLAWLHANYHGAAVHFTPNAAQANAIVDAFLINHNKYTVATIVHARALEQKLERTRSDTRHSKYLISFMDNMHHHTRHFIDDIMEYIDKIKNELAIYYDGEFICRFNGRMEWCPRIVNQGRREPGYR